MKSDSRVVRVHYPLKDGRIILRTDADWDRDIEPARETGSDEMWEFVIRSRQPFFYFKPMFVRENTKVWSRGENYLATSFGTKVRDVFPYFLKEDRCCVCDLQVIESTSSGQRIAYRVFLPPGYYENAQRRYPVLYMQDGQNLFFREEAYGGEHWGIPETLAVLDSMCAIEQVIVVGIYPNRREHDYTRAGYGPYGEFIVERLKPRIDSAYRTLPEPQQTAIMGSSLGGVFSLHMAWEYPGVFGLAGRDLLYFAFPHALHNERAWSMRSQIPFQFFFEHQIAANAC